MNDEGISNKVMPEDNNRKIGLGFYHPEETNIKPDEEAGTQEEEGQMLVNRITEITKRLTDPAIVSRWKSNEFEEIKAKIQGIREDLEDRTKDISFVDMNNRLDQVDKMIDSGSKDITIEEKPIPPRNVPVELSNNEIPSIPESTGDQPRDTGDIHKLFPPGFSRFDGSELPSTEQKSNLKKIEDQINRKYDQARANLREIERDLLAEHAKDKNNLAKLTSLNNQKDILDEQIKKLISDLK